ncbi:MAG: nucleotide sugar dehydrogenase [Pirellulaceae bacterium]
MGGVIGFAGLSHLGIVSSIATASKGFRVVAWDGSEILCDELTAGELPVHEPGLPELLEDCRGRIEFTADAERLHDCDVVVFSIDIPTSSANESDCSALDRLIDSVLPQLSPQSTLVVLSQVRPGYTRGLSERIHATPGFENTVVHYQVETLIFGRAVERAVSPERFMIGCADPAEPLPPAFQAMLEAFDCPLLPMRFESAELCKTAINLFLVASVSTTNTLSELCEGIGADWFEIAPALRLDKRIGPHAYLHPGLGLSGGNLERDLVTLTSLACQVGSDHGVIDAYVNNSVYRRDWVLRTLHEQLDTGRRKPQVAVWGLAYKPQTHSIKNSPSVALIEHLRAHHVAVYDPQAKFPGAPPRHVIMAETALDACRGADALIVMTPWPEFGSIDLQQAADQLNGSLVLDPLGCLDEATCRRLGLAYRKLGVNPLPKDLAA